MAAAQVVLDFFLQGFCECSLVLLPSAYYNAAAVRGSRGRLRAMAHPHSLDCRRHAPECPWGANER